MKLTDLDSESELCRFVIYREATPTLSNTKRFALHHHASDQTRRVAWINSFRVRRVVEDSLASSSLFELEIETDTSLDH
jgi:hypothetical protein